MKKIIYKFNIEKNKSKEVEIKLREPSLEYINDYNTNPPDWAKLNNKKCSVCGLDKNNSEYCPIARNIAPLIKEFSKYISYKEIKLEIITKERNIYKKIPMADGLSSLFGIIMTTSGCKPLNMLRPMVFTHLPFATSKETIIRVLSNYLLGQYFRKTEGLTPEWDLKGLLEIYKQISEINLSFINRLRGMGIENDAHLNALVKLDCFNFFITSTINDEQIVNLKEYFHPFFKK
ncbi:MAG: DUF6901 family protein [Candidatus Muiribacteriota bacterium]